MNLENLIKEGSRSLKEKNINSYKLDAELLLSNAMGISKEFLLLNNNLNISPKKIEKYKKLINRRVKKEPIAYIVGKKEFWSQSFIVNRSTLVPRPETELMLYKLVKYFKNKKINILDIGTGTGCILLSLLKELKSSRGIGIDISNSTIKTAMRNSKALNLLNRSKFKVCDLNEFNYGKYDLIVSNPPYIPSRDIKSLSQDITSFEPLVALNGGKDGLDLIKKVIYKSSVLLKKNGLFSLEIGTNQYAKVLNIMNVYKFRIVWKEYDCNDNVRCIISTKHN
tara:strand:- start:2110 stop:2952 length:843 start_codon:yes stop_codon:yes gene_type:complete